MKTFRIKTTLEGVTRKFTWEFPSFAHAMRECTAALIEGRAVTHFEITEIEEKQPVSAFCEYDFSKPPFIPLEPIGYRFREKIL
jgi:hypothetical protein